MHKRRQPQLTYYDPGKRPGVARAEGTPVELDPRKRRRQVVALLAAAMVNGTRQVRRKLARELVDIDIRLQRRPG